MRWVLVFLSMFIFPAYADIFKCKRSDGTICYQDRPCKPGEQLQDINKHDIHEVQQLLHKRREAIIKERNREVRRQLVTARQQEAEQKRRLRLQSKCERVKQQIALLNQRYRAGYTLRQGLVLDRKLAECNFRKQQYCTAE